MRVMRPIRTVYGDYGPHRYWDLRPIMCSVHTGILDPANFTSGFLTVRLWFTFSSRLRFDLKQLLLWRDYQSLDLIRHVLEVWWCSTTLNASASCGVFKLKQIGISWIMDIALDSRLLVRIWRSRILFIHLVRCRRYIRTSRNSWKNE